MPSDSSSKTRQWLNDILHHIVLAQTFVGEMDCEAFVDDLLRFHAVTRCLEIISEASRRLPDDLKLRHASIPWREMAGAGNVYRHDYEDVAAAYVWTTVQKRLPALRCVVEEELAVSGS